MQEFVCCILPCVKQALGIDFVLLRMNIVGAENEVLAHMHKTGSLKLVDRVSIITFLSFIVLR